MSAIQGAMLRASWRSETLARGVVPAIEESVPSAFNYTRATTIYGGSNEIQKNIIAQMSLGVG